MYIVKKDLDPINKLDQRVVITSLNIDAEAEIVRVSYRVETLSPTGVVIAKSDPLWYDRYNSLEEYGANGKITKEANMKFDRLRESSIGQEIIKLLQEDIDNYPNFNQA